MAKVKRVIFVVCIMCLVLYLTVDLSEARRGGGGGSRGGGSRGSRGSRGTRSRSSRVTRSRSKHFLSSKSATRTAIIAGTIYGATAWRRRRMYRGDSSKVPTVCYNSRFTVDPETNKTVYGRFICPMDGQEEGRDYCCGEEGAQTCCKFFDDGGRVAGVVIGIIVFAVVVAVAVFCICKHMKNRKGSGGTVLFKPKKQVPHEQAMPLKYAAPTPAQTYQDHPQPNTVTYPALPTENQPMVPPPSYGAASNGELPYDINPTGEKPPLPPGNVSNAPYPSADMGYPNTGLPYAVQPQPTGQGYPPPAGGMPYAYPPPGQEPYPGTTAPPSGPGQYPPY